MPQEIFLVLISVSRYINPNATVHARRMSVTPPGIEPSIFELVAQCLNQMQHVPQQDIGYGESHSK